MSYDPEYALISQKLEVFIRSIQNEIFMLQTTSTHAQELKRNLLVLELQSFKNVPAMNKNSAVDLFRQKYLLMLQLKFSPFIQKIDFIFWRKGAGKGVKFDFYSTRDGEGSGHSPRASSKSFIDHAIVEVIHEDHSRDLLKRYQEVVNSKAIAAEAKGTGE